MLAIPKKPKLMIPEKAIGWLLIIGAAGVLVPYTILTISFDYPDILRKETTIILSRFHEGGRKLIWTWFWFALGGITLYQHIFSSDKSWKADHY
jgi:hypothetical protein